MSAHRSPPPAAITAEALGKRFWIGDKAHRETFWDTTRRLLTGAGQRRILWALKDLSFQVGRGEVLGVIGANGAGKSTLLLTLAGILAPTEGTLKVDGRASSFFGLSEGLQPKMTVLENFRICAALLGMDPGDFEARREAIVAYSGLGDYRHARFGELSSGLAARLAFSVAVHSELDIILIDEMLAVGDQAFQSRCLATMKALKEQGKTMVIVSHGLSLIESLCDRTLYLDAGRQAFLGPSPEAVRLFLKKLGQAPRRGGRAERAAKTPPPHDAPDGQALLAQAREAAQRAAEEACRAVEERAGAWLESLQAAQAGWQTRAASLSSELASALTELRHSVGGLGRLREEAAAAARQAAQEAAGAHNGQALEAARRAAEEAALPLRERARETVEAAVEEAAGRLQAEARAAIQDSVEESAGRLKELAASALRQAEGAEELLKTAAGAGAARIEEAGLALRAAAEEEVGRLRAAREGWQGQTEALLSGLRETESRLRDTAEGLSRPGVEAALRRALADVGVDEALQSWKAKLRHEGLMQLCPDMNVAFVSAMNRLMSPAFERPLRPGDEVVTTACVPHHIAACLLQLKLRPVLVDIDPATCNMDPDRLETAVGPATRAVVLPYLAGSCPPVERIREFCDRKTLYLVESAGQYLGCAYKDRPLGTWGDAACLSAPSRRLLPETWSLCLLGPVHGSSPPRSRPLTEVEAAWGIMPPAPPQRGSLALNLALEESRNASALASRRAETGLRLRQALAPYADFLSSPAPPQSLQGGPGFISLVMSEGGPFPLDALRSALASAGAFAQAGPHPFWKAASASRCQGPIRNAPALAERSLNLMVEDQDPGRLAEVLARFFGPSA